MITPDLKLKINEVTADKVRHAVATRKCKVEFYKKNMQLYEATYHMKIF